MTQGGWGQPSGPPAQQPWGSPPQPAQPPGGSPPQPWPRPAEQGWQQPPPGWQYPAAPPKRAPIAAVLIGALVVITLGFAAFVITALVVRQDSPPGAPTAPPTATSVEPSPGVSSAEPSPSTSPIEPTPPPSDGYDPPPLPAPQTWEEAERWLTANALYDHDVAPVDCGIARLDDPVAPALEVLDVHLNATMDCLMGVWIDPMTAAGFILPQPPVRSYDQPITTACGESPPMDYAAAFYCPGDQRIFYAVNRDWPLFRRTSLEVDNTLAHEFGHLLQGRTGIISASWAFRSTAATEDEELEYSRRTELQADCFGGMAMNSLAEATQLTGEERELLKDDTYSRGDREGRPRTHGTPDSGLRWITTGLESAFIGACNTFAASAEDVA